MCPWPLARSAGRSAFVTRTTPSTFDSYIARQRSSSASAIGSRPRAPPAECTIKLTSSSAPASSSTEAGSVTSRRSARPPTSRATSSQRSTRRAAATMSKPAAARTRALAAPIPLEAPVTIAVPRDDDGAISAGSQPRGPARRRLLRERAGLPVADRDVVVLVHHLVDRVLHELAVEVDLEDVPVPGLIGAELGVAEPNAPDREELAEGEWVRLVGLHVDDPIAGAPAAQTVDRGVVRMHGREGPGHLIEPDLGRHVHLLSVHEDVKPRMDVVDRLAQAGQAHCADAVGETAVERRPGRRGRARPALGGRGDRARARGLVRHVRRAIRPAAAVRDRDDDPDDDQRDEDARRRVADDETPALAGLLGPL